MRYKMVIQYDGSKYHGFQRQNKFISVQEVIEKAFKRIFNETVIIHASGRTDAGVHAVGQVIHFDTIVEIEPKNIMKVLNRVVFPYIRAISCEVVTNEFHARKSAIKKEYRYYVNIGKYDVFKADLIHHFHNNLDMNKLREAMTYIVGTHDFASFNKNKELLHTVRTIEKFDLTITGDILEFSIIGNGFMHNMVRIIIAVMLKVAEGKFEPDHVKTILEGKNRKYAPYVAPSNGLYLYKVYYE